MLNDCVIEIFDATVAGKPQKVRLESVEGTVKDIRVPELTSRTRAGLKGIVKGPNRSGSVTIEGWVEVAQKNAVLATQIRNVDLTLFEPYLISKARSGIDAGTLDLELKSTVRKNVVDANGTLTVSALKLTIRKEGLIPALESAHAFAQAFAEASSLSKDDIILINQSGRGDKDIFTIADALGDPSWREFIRRKAEAYSA